MSNNTNVGKLQLHRVKEHVASPVLVSESITIPGTPFPRKIWQTSKVSPGGMGDEDRQAINTWTKINPKHRYEAMTAYSAESYVRSRFASQPDLVEVFIDLQDPILRADLIRYLVLLGDGGVYSDIDTHALKPIDEWIPPSLARNISVVVGVEYDVLDGGRWGDWTLDLQFCTWTIMARPNHEMFQRTVDRVVRGLKRLAYKQGVSIAGIKASFADVLDTTGPGLFTEAVFEYLTEKLGEPFTWKNVTRLQREILIEDVLILPITAFGSGQAHSNSGKPDEDGAYVQHMFKGSWKGDHPLVIPVHDDHTEAEKQQVEKAEQEEETKQQEEGEEKKKRQVEQKKHHEEQEQKRQQYQTTAQNTQGQAQSSETNPLTPPSSNPTTVSSPPADKPDAQQTPPELIPRGLGTEKHVLASLRPSRVWQRHLDKEH